MNRIAISILEFIGNTLWGFRPNLMKDIVAVHGGRKSLIWFATNMPKYEKTLKEWGAERTHLLATVISGINGCPYCTHGHSLSFQLHYFQNKGNLFPLDEKEMTNFNSKTEQEVINELSKAFDETRLLQEKKDLERLIQLKNKPELAINSSDNRMIHLIEMFSFLNICGIEKQTELDLAHSPISKSSELYQKYKQERALFHSDNFS